ncbi:ribonuclease T2 family protein [Oceaniglobus ichthyenteri]|uniref:ribonuclease T2 family protein n=1 Tax=Oceaniglobus ichthyenteri TaxID=2136177 RepID=UPI000D363843|nr:ribonuclease T2 [Oceaniglobus ichthyenteri]
MRLLLALMLWPTLVWGEGERAGTFDYYVLALSWSPTWCALEGNGRQSPQCGADADNGWVMHGLWPQFHRGYPSYCRTTARDPSRGQTRAMADIMGDPGAAWYQWKKHGRCAGLSADDYFATARRAYDNITRPEVFRKLDRAVKLPASVIEDAFIKDNPTLTPDMITITCKANRIQEARICLSKSLSPVPCGRDVIRDCTMQDALFAPIP